jgi:serine/threonine protein kinase
MALSPGEKLGHYEIVGLLGKGGMGEVYRAHDARLQRDVAVKVSEGRFSERFTREARVVASLNHPNICHLYDVGADYLVMELVEGPTLAERLKQGPIPVDEALGIAQQIADALEAAHEKGVVHRDLKPGNVKITPEGHGQPVQSVYMAVDVAGDATFQAGVPRKLFDGPPTTSRPDITADGKRYLIPVLLGTTGAATSTPFNVVLNWQAALKK